MERQPAAVERQRDVVRVARVTPQRRCANGLLTPEHPRVYGVGPDTPIPLAADQAALLWAHPAALSDQSAAAAFSLTPSPGAVHVTPLQGNPGQTNGVVVHRRLITPGDITTRHGSAPPHPRRGAACPSCARSWRTSGRSTVSGLRVSRATWRQLTRRPHALVAHTAVALARLHEGV